ncbi:hypothetical protein Asi02nite_80560 [Asanoa siamensis]|uniref:Uncharacterized protein n=1 Tax=Asanoa siamensis TaxID=926357 RepID=A0ABQ4D4R8_9ACTN|nr:hypothetical protein Asi02nite_80560 [Asanoa siamensis]
MAGYRAAHCAAVNEFTNSAGNVAYRGQGQAFCQRASDGVIVQCAGISQTIQIYDYATDRLSAESNFRCGRYVNHNPACPAGRFQNVGVGMTRSCPGSEMYGVVLTTVILPGSGSTQRSDDYFFSSPMFVDCT